MDDRSKKVRDAVMDTFRGWGGYWNVTPRAPAADAEPGESWKLRVHSHPFTHAELDVDLVDAYLDDPDDEELAGRWQAALRPIFDQARGQAG
ncbi:MAG: hypothetical protein GWN99_16480 [Gemmatimonadetes bacterium]|uniref:Uncharacterized protein n=1 Tax=Candidatus Kutchimonas denitrificans TaxID=3056748 RepID=A0AAE5C8D3_9BACT|nr:hypothetical protein [Gemmatimonadota bacterium]NIR74386.1 hypothetical protein [Candidatus Kutchimonas denitrificans]NIS02637.1 hypothetical protein [Gemmatimonadota bacterium]NIT68512.1 hypothetical protein [Gemmatimonadota bacterium]NIU51989.1 hypothetical protein [Gemmatimonadota bacterium]